MPARGIVRNSGNVPLSAGVVVVNGYNYIIKSYTPQSSGKITYANDQYGNEGGAGYVQLQGLLRGSFNLQFTTTASLASMPKEGDLLIVPANYGSGSCAFSASIMNPGNPQTAGEVMTMDLEYIELSQGNS